MKEDGKKVGYDTDKAMAKAGTAKTGKSSGTKTEMPLSEKDKVKNAEDELRLRMKRKYDQRRKLL